MVLAGIEIMISEVRLAEMCDCTVFGTEAFQAVQALRQLGFGHAGKYNLTMPDLAPVLRGGEYPVVYVDLPAIAQGVGIHAMVIIAVDDRQVQVLDPLQGERWFDRSNFEAAWQLTNGLTILLNFPNRDPSGHGPPDRATAD
jgi:ABC-type bacteriocin/lantibiotic exporter with double-glycine peptidase domain